jgi:hypothetical protein
MYEFKIGQQVTIPSGLVGTILRRGEGDAEWYWVQLPYGEEWRHSGDLTPA